VSSDFRRLPRVLLAAAALLATALLIVWGSGALGLWQGADVNRGPARLGADFPEPPGAVPGGSPRTGPGTELVFDTADRCRRVDAWVEPAGAARAGLDASGLEAVLAGWRVFSFTPERVHLLPAGAGGDCPDARPFTLTIRDGEVVILEGRGLDGPLRERSGIAAAWLAPGDRALLERGHTVAGLDRAWEYLEGIDEHRIP